MAEIESASRSALADAFYGQFGSEGPAGVILTAMPETSIISVLVASNAGDITATLDAVAAEAGGQWRKAGYRSWFLIGDVGRCIDPALIDTRLSPSAAVVDQSHGRVRIAIEGPRATSALAKGTAVDLDTGQFQVGQSTQTLLGHIAIHMTRIGVDSFELIVLRSFALSLWDDLITMGREFGVEARRAYSGQG